MPESLGVGRFAKIGIPLPQVSAPFVGVVAIAASVLLLNGLLTRVAASDIAVAIATTKIPPYSMDARLARRLPSCAS